MQTVTLPLSLRDLSDNFRNPLTGILGLAHLLKSQTRLTPQQREFVEGIETSGQALKVLADKLLLAKAVS